MTAKRPASRSTTSKTATAKKTRPPPGAARSPCQGQGAVAGKVKAKAASRRPPQGGGDEAGVEAARGRARALAELKAVDVKALDVRGITDITDTMVVASGTSDRHVKSLAERVTQRCKEAGFPALRHRGERDGEWVLLDLQDVVLHVMLAAGA